jgi:hypothetical protein
LLHLSHRIFFAAAILAGASAATPAAAQVPAGVLECTVSGGVGVVVASTKALSCIYHRGPHRRPDFYVGSISHIGFDLGITGQGHLLFGVLAPAPILHHYALAGSYAGPLIGVTVGGGTDANGLVSSNGAIALQSLPGSATTGLDLTAGIGSLTLAPAPLPPGPVHYYRHYHHGH